MTSTVNMTQREEKVALIMEKSIDGFCYIKLCVMLPNFDNIEFDVFKDSLNRFMLTCGSRPIAKEMMVELAVMELRFKHILNGGESDADSLVFDSKIFSEMMESGARFSLEEFNEDYHVGTFICEGDGCVHNDLVCNHGYSARFVVVALGATNRKVGGTVVDLDDIFGEESSDLTMTPSELIKNVRHSTGYGTYMEDIPEDIINDPSFDSFQPWSAVRKQEKEEEEDLTEEELYKRSPVLEKIMMKMDEMDRKLNEKLKQQMDQNSSSSGDDLSPSDSRSNMDAMNKRFMRAGTVLNTRQSGKSKLEDIVEVSPLLTNKEVVLGFVKTPGMITKERLSHSRVQPINGLARPFSNNRLNLLLHFDTAVRTNMPIDDDTGFAISLIKILRMSTRTPSEQLVKQIIERTFDFEDRVIIANPFKLPFIEIGMNISDNALAACFRLLSDELKSLWFSSMKGLRVPKFHTEFDMYSESEIGGRPMRSKSKTSKRGKTKDSVISTSSQKSRQRQDARWF